MICVPNFSSLGWFSFSSAVNSCYQMLTFFWELDSHIGPKVGLSAKFQLGWLIWGPATKCDVQTTRRTTRCTTRHTTGLQVKIELNPALLGWCQGLSWAIKLHNWDVVRFWEWIYMTQGCRCRQMAMLPTCFMRRKLRLSTRWRLNLPFLPICRKVHCQWR